MNTIQDLRSALDRQARALHDDHVVARTVAVRGRVRAVRRRRAAAVVAAAAVAVAGVVATVTPGGGDDAPPPADRRVAGAIAPATMTSLGWTYEFADAVDGDELGGRLELEHSDEPRLVSWATPSAQQDVEYQLARNAPGRSAAADFADFLWIPPGYEGHLSVGGTPGVGVAVYELGDGAPEGYTREGVTFRQGVAGQRLLGAVVGDRGEADLELEVPRGGGLALSHLCTAGPRGTWVHLSIDGREVTWGAGCSDGTWDPGAAGNVSGSYGSRTDPVSLRIWATDGENGPVVEDDDLLLGLGVYAVPAPGDRAAGMAVERLVEHDGHLWRLVDTTTGDLGQRKLTTPSLPGAPTLVGVYFARLDGGIAHAVRDGRRVEGGFFGGQGATVAGVLHGEGTAGATVTGDPGPRVRLGVARYERID